MSIIKRLSDVLKEVFWIKPSRKKKTAARKSTNKKAVKKKNTLKKSVVKAKKTVQDKTVKAAKPPKEEKLSKIPPKAKSKAPQLDPSLVKAGEITHYFERIKVCVVKITQGTVLIGDKLTIIGHKSKFVQKVWSMQIESQDVKVAQKGQLIGLKVDKPVTVGDIVYK